MYYLKQTMTTELEHSEINVVYLELLVVMTDRFKIVRIHARNVPRTRTQALRRRRRRISHVFLRKAPVFLMLWGAVLLKHKKTCSGTTCACLGVASKQESCRDSMPSSL